MNKRVVVTGMGVISSIGANITDFWSNCLQGRTVVQPIPEQWLDHSDFHSRIWSPLPEIDFSRTGFGKVEQSKLDKISLLAMDAAFQALENANLPFLMADEKRNTYFIKDINPDQTGVFLGTGVGGISTSFLSHAHQILARHKTKLNQWVTDLERQGRLSADDLAELKELEASLIVPRRFNPFTVSMLMPNAPAANLSIKLGITGPSNTLCAACASGTVAIGHGFRAIQAGNVNLAIAGAAEYLYDDYGSIYQGFDIVRTLATTSGDFSEANRPFDERRSGFLFSQGGAGVLILEELTHAQKRQANILAEITGFAESSDSYNIMIPEEKGELIQLMFRKVLEEAGCLPEQIDYLNAHGTGTIANDLMEVGALEKIFGKKALINSTKSLLGHSLGASGAIETIVTVLSLRNQTTHICKNLENPIRDLNFVTEAHHYPMETAITHSFAFGGHNAALVIKRWPNA